MQLDENDDNVLSWDNISYAVASTAKAAYLYDKKQELPSPLENIDSHLLDLFIENLKEINKDFHRNVPAVKKFVEDSARPSKVAALEELKKLGLINEYR